MPDAELTNETRVTVSWISKEKILEEFKKAEGDGASLSKEAKAKYERKYEQGIAFIESMGYDDLEEFAETLKNDTSSEVNSCIWRLVKDSV